MDSLFDFTIYEMQVCLLLYPALSSTKALQHERRKTNIALVRIYTLSDSRESFEKLYLAF